MVGWRSCAQRRFCADSIELTGRSVVFDHQRMGKKDPRVDAYIERSAPFAKPVLKHLRKIVHRGCPDVTETIKWNMPHFEHKGILCGMAAFKAHCAFHFWKGQLVLGSQEKENEAMGQFGRITSVDELPSDKTLIGWVQKAAELRDKGIIRPTKRARRKPLPVPSYLTAVLKKNPAARETFETLSPSHRREYIQWLTEAKRDDTRKRRLTTAVQWLTEGKPQNWRYIK